MEKRRSLRYHPTESKALQLFYYGDDGIKVDVPALVVNESRKGMAVILVGFYFFPKKSSIYWQETTEICSHWTVIRCKELDENIYRLSLELSELPAHMGIETTQ